MRRVAIKLAKLRPSCHGDCGQGRRCSAYAFEPSRVQGQAPAESSKLGDVVFSIGLALIGCAVLLAGFGVLMP